MSSTISSTISTAADLDRLDFSKSGGLVTVVAQDTATGTVLMVAHANREALEQTLRTGEMFYQSRSRGLWHKGETSGNVQRVKSLHHDCDNDAVLALVEPAGPACHTGAVSCFGVEGEPPVRTADALRDLDDVIRARADASLSDDKSYTRKLLGDRNLRLKKLGEEAAELVVACADNDRERAANEGADIIYHTLVALRALGVGLDDVSSVLAARAGTSTRR